MMRTKCITCGDEIDVDAGLPEEFVDRAAIVAVCPRCATRELLESGGQVVDFREDPPGALFPLGPVAVTPGAVESLAGAGRHLAEFLGRHVAGDWGKAGRLDETEVTANELRHGAAVTDNEAKLNAIALHHRRGRVMSIYPTRESETLWIFTYLEAPRTEVLLPSEY
jgi:hypothetical protein